MKLSIILCTINRIKEVEEFLDSLNNQGYNNFELILVDQNKDKRLFHLLAPKKYSFNIKHLQSPPGLSRGRNIALPHITGDIVAVPDDDCLYPNMLLKEVVDFFKKNTHSVLNIRIINSLNNGYRWPSSLNDKEMTIKDSFSSASCAIFIQKKVFDTIGGFDENLGPGAVNNLIGSEKLKILGGEDIDIIIRAINHGFKCYYNSVIIVMHPLLNLSVERKNNTKLFSAYNKRMESAGASDFYILKKHFAFSKRLHITLNNFFAIIYFLLIKFDIESSLRHLHRFKGMMHSIIRLKSI